MRTIGKKTIMSLVVCIAAICITTVHPSAKMVPSEDLIGGRRPSGYPDEMSAMPCCNVEINVTPKAEIPHYKVNGVLMDPDMQDFIYHTCERVGIPDYYPYFLCQIYQESKFDPYVVSKNGLDYGYCQLRIYYHDSLKKLVGHPEWDLINDPFANVYVGAYLMASNINEAGSYAGALALYFNSGNEEDNNKYILDVTQWYPTLERIN